MKKNFCIFIVKRFGLLVFVVGFLILLEIVAPSLINAQVVINEFSSESSDDWIELYAFEDTDISGWVLDDHNTDTNMSVIPDSTSIGPSTNEFYVVEVGRRLNMGGDVITLFQENGSTQVGPSVPYGNQGGVCAPGAGQSAGRVDDGNVIERFSGPTKGTTNVGSSLAPCPSPTPEPTNTPTPTPKPTNTPVPTNTTKPTIAPTKVTANSLDDSGSNGEVNEEGLVLSEKRDELSEEDSDEKENDVEPRGNIPLAAGAFVVAGIGFIGAAFYPFFKKVRKGYNLEDDDNKKKTDQIL